MYESSDFPIFNNTCNYLFYYSHSGGCEVVPHYGVYYCISYLENYLDYLPYFKIRFFTIEM